jgi:hypothetical protein
MHYVRSVLLNSDYCIKTSRREAHLDNTRNLKESVVTSKKITLQISLRRPVYLWK